MRVLTRCELMSFPPAELVSLLSQISAVLPTLPEGSLDRRIALINMDNIKRELAQRDMTAGRWVR